MNTHDPFDGLVDVLLCIAVILAAILIAINI